MDPFIVDRGIVADATGVDGIARDSHADAPSTAPAPAPRPPVRPSARVRADGKFLSVDGRRFWVKGVTYGTFAPNEQGEPYPAFDKLKDDFAQMRDAGINTVRLYSPPSDRIADAAADAGLHLIPDICWGPRYCELHREQDLKAIYDWTREHAKRLARHPAMLMYSIGNEIPPLLVRWYGRPKIERFLRELNEIVKAEDDGALTTYACHPPTEHLHLPFIDVVSFNVYLEREPEFRRYLARLQNLAGARPLMLSEIGLDSSANGEEAQARLLKWQLRATAEIGLCGSTIYSWTDEWAIFNEGITGWSFGLTTNDRKPKLALDTVKQIFNKSHYELRKTPWPKVSVVVCSYNGGKTLESCLRSLSHLSYPNYETLVIDDGSTDDTSAIAQRFPVRCIRTDNQGLSRARNLGIAESTGSIVAFIDADAYADRDWLFHMVSALEQHDASAVGGPNLSPPNDGFVAQCVDHAPGNPTHVLIDDERAEHIPGCNMAYRKDALAAIGNFDEIHRAAGDDVDVCWKLLARDLKIVYAPGAVVWHHRRPTLRAFWKQQKGYGYAESQLRKRYPGRFNVFGYAVWSGGIYDGVHHGLRMDGLPQILRPKVYQGRFGSAQFQSLYQPFHAWWFQIFTAFEWQLATACVIASTLLTFLHSPLGGVALAALAVAMLAAMFAAAAAAGWHAVRSKQWQGNHRIVGGTLVALLHVLQPLARASGRFKGWRLHRKETIAWPATEKLWGNLSQRDRWLERLVEHIRSCGWRADVSCDWSDGDITVHGPGPYRLTLTSVAEEKLEKNYFWVRYRVTPKLKKSAVLVTAGLVAAVAGIAMHPVLLPLAIPVLVALRVQLGARRSMTSAISQLAMEIAEANKMPKAEGEFAC